METWRTPAGLVQIRRGRVISSNRISPHNFVGRSRRNALRCNAPNYNVSFGAYVRHLFALDTSPYVFPEDGVPSFDFNATERAGQFANLALKIRVWALS